MSRKLKEQERKVKRGGKKGATGSLAEGYNIS
jgi:hypothetical protein